MFNFLFLKKILEALSEKERHALWAACAVAAISLAGLITIFVRTATEVIPAQGGRYIEGMVGQPTYINPVLATSHIDRSLVRLLFAPLSDLAETIDTEEGGRLVRVRLKENLMWGDGKQLTSDDIIFTVEQIQDPETRSPFFSSWQGVAASRGSQLEIIFRLATPYAFFIENLDDFYPLPKHLFSEVPAANWRLSDYNLQPIGSGPYSFTSYEKRSDGFITAYHLEKNPSYTGDTPHIAQFDVRFFPRVEDEIRGFNSGQINGLVIFDPVALDTIQRSFELTVFPSPTVYGVFWNQSQNLALQAKEVRRALAYAIDRNTLTKEALRGYGDAAYSPLPPALPFVPETLRAATSSREIAVQLLESHGWKLTDEGVREQKVKNGSIQLSFELLVPDVPFLITTARALQNSWESIGARVTVAIASPGDEVESNIKNRNYQAVLFGNSVRKNGDLFSFWHSSERFYPGLNLALYNNKTADRIIEDVRQSFAPEERQARLEALQEVIAEDVPALFLYSPHYLYVTDKETQGISPRFLQDAADRFSNVSSWFLKTARVIKE